MSLVPEVQMNPPFKVYKAASGVGRPYKLWDPVDLESDEEILNLGRDLSLRFKYLPRCFGSSRAFEREWRRRGCKEGRNRTGGR